MDRSGAHKRTHDPEKVMLLKQKFRYFGFANTTCRTSIFPDRNPASQ